MTFSQNRRNFLSTCAAGATLLAAAPLAAIEPIQRNGDPKFKFSLAAYSYRELFRNKEITFSDFVADCAKMQLDGAELTSYFFDPKVTAEELLALKAECFRLGLDVSGTAVGNDFGVAEEEKYRAQIDHVKAWVDRAAVMSAPVIRIFAGHAKTDAATAHKQMVAGIEECCDYAGKRGIYLALENHGGPTATAKGLLQFVNDVKSPWFGVNLDTGNFHGDDIYGELAEVAPYALNVQIKVAISGPDKKKKPADFGKVAKLLREANYRGYIVLEYEEKGDPRKECPKFVEQLREAFA